MNKLGKNKNGLGIAVWMLGAALALAAAGGTVWAADTITPATSPAGMGKTAETPRDYSNPKGAAKTFLQAVKNADLAAMEDAVVMPANPEQREAVGTFLASTISGTKLQQAAAARFGMAESKAFDPSQSAVDARLKAIDAAEVDINGDTAKITLPSDPVTHLSGGPIAFKKVGGQWKLDGAVLFGLDAASPKETAARVQRAKALLAVSDQVAVDIKAGKYLSATDAYQDLMNRSRVVSNSLSAATAPAAPR